MGKPFNKKKSESAKPSADARGSDQTSVRSTAETARSEPTLTILRLSPNNWNQWQKENEIYFAHKYEQYGQFFETKERYKVAVPKKPKVKTARVAASDGSSSTSARSTTARVETRRRAAQATTANAPAATERGAPDLLSGSESDSDDSDSGSDYGDSGYESDEVDDEATASYLHQKRLDNMVREQQKLKSVETAMYADLLRSLCSEAAATVRTSSQFELARERKDPVLLLKICHKKLRQYSTARGITKKLESAKSLHRIQQHGSELTSDYYDKFIREVEVYENLTGATLPEDYKAALFTDGLNNRRYAAMKVEIANGTTKQKKTLTGAYHQAMKRMVLNETEGKKQSGVLAANFHVTEKATKPPPKKETARKIPEKSSSTPKGSKKSNDSEKKTGKNKFKCTTCKLLGKESYDHRAHECPNESKAQALCEEAVMMAHEEFDINPGLEQAKSSSRNHVHMLSTTEAAMAGVQGRLQDDEIIFDSGSTINLFHNEKLLEGETKPSKLGGIVTYGGKAMAVREGTYKAMKTYVNHDGPANIISQSMCRKAGGDVRYDEQRDEFTAKLPGHEAMKFTNRDDLSGLYVFTPPREHLHVTVKERLKIYKKRDQKKAIEARMLVPNLGFPSDKDYASLLNNNLANNMPVSAADVYRANRIFGKDIPSYMGKTTKRKKSPIDLEKIDVIIDKNVDLGMDVFIVNNGAYMLSVSSFAYKMVTYMGLLNKTMTNDGDTFWFHIKTHANAYRARGFTVKTLETDDEGAFLANRTRIEGLGIQHVPTYGSKVEECERAVRTIKERHRAYLFHVKFPVTHLMEVYLVINCTRLLNAFPTHGKGYDHIPTTEIFRGSKLDWRVDFPVAYGDVCLVPGEVNEMESKTAKARGEIAIAMLPLGNPSGDIIFLNTRTMRKIIRNHFTVIPTPQSIIDRFEQHVGNRFAERRRNPIYRNLRGIVHDRVPETADEKPEAAGRDAIMPAAEPELPVHRETSDAVEQEIVEHILPDPSVATSDIDLPVTPAEFVHIPAEHEGDDPPAKPPEQELSTDGSVLADEVLPDEQGGEEVPTASLEDLGNRYPRRANRTSWRERSFFVLNTSASKLLNIEPRHRLKAMAKEIYGIAVLKKAIKPINVNSLTYKQLKGVISSKLFTKAKFSPDGEFEKWKARLVAGGHMQRREEYSHADTSSPAVGTTSLFTVAAIAAKENRKTATVDFTAAYLNADMKEGKLILMRLSRETSHILCLLVPAYKRFLREDGTMIVKLTKALYGCVESAKLWYNSISQTLIDDGFVRNSKDQCIFNKMVDGAQITICLYVDDLLLTSINLNAIKATIDMLKSKYADMTSTISDRLKYVGMILDFSSPGVCKVSMPNFVATIILDAEVTGIAATPAAMDLFATCESDSRLENEKSELFHSLVMKLQYLAKRVRPDILLPVIFLSSRVTKSTERDWVKLIRVVKYLNGTKDVVMTLKPDEGLISIYAFVDASFAVHHDFKSHTGAVITFGQGCIYFKSTKQRLNTRSSTEAELVGVSDALTTIIWLRDFLLDQGYDVGPAVLYQDNMSTIAMLSNGSGSNERTRHINIKFFFAHDRIEKGEVVVKYMPTDDMLADMLTKPIQGEKFKLMRNRILGIN